MIDRSGTWWKGESFSDLATFIAEYSERYARADQIVPSACTACGGTSHSLVVDDEAGVAMRSCTACGTTAFLADSAEHWEDAEPGDAACPCGSEQFEVGVGFSLRKDGDVRWVTVGCRCLACGILGVYVDWKIDYSPTGHLLAGT